MPVPFSGACACGAIRFSCAAEPYVSYACHCTECRKRTASAFGVSVQVPTEGVRIDKGRPRSRQRLADSGNTVTIRFCGDCGTSLFSNSAARPDVTVIYAGTLDDPSWVPIQANIWTASALPWVHLAPEVERFAKAPDFSRYYAARPNG